jgi:hypothetical protein
MRSRKKQQLCSGFSIIEATIALVILVIAIMGTIQFRYYSSLDVRRSNLHDSASRVALMLCESWRGLDGTLTFDPVEEFEPGVVVVATDGPGEPNGFTLLGKYSVFLENRPYYAALSYRDIDVDLRALNITVVWEQRGLDETELPDADKIYQLTTYTEQ